MHRQRVQSDVTGEHILRKALCQKHGREEVATDKSVPKLDVSHIRSVASNTITAKHVDLEVWAREMGVLRPYEAVAI